MVEETPQDQPDKHPDDIQELLDDLERPVAPVEPAIEPVDTAMDSRFEEDRRRAKEATHLALGVTSEADAEAIAKELEIGAASPRDDITQEKRAMKKAADEQARREQQQSGGNPTV